MYKRQFIQYLEQDGIKLPHDEKSFYTEKITPTEDNEYSDWDDEEEELEQEGKKSQDIEPLKDFPELHSRIKEIIADMGAVTPKLNWSAPRDATWILPNNTMKCNEVNEVYLLLNASNYIMHDLQHAFDGCIDDGKSATDKPLQYELILREWFDINPALEFRVFVKDKKIVGASQRDLNYYDFLNELSDQLKDLIEEFVEDIIVPQFEDDSFVVDLYIPRPFNKVFLIDINPFARKTDSLLFSWNELVHIELSGKDYELRLLTENNTGRFASKEHSENQVPRDLVDASLNPDAIRELTQKWKDLLSRQNGSGSDTESESESEDKV